MELDNKQKKILLQLVTNQIDTLNTMWQAIGDDMDKDYEQETFIEPIFELENIGQILLENICV